MREFKVQGHIRAIEHTGIHYCASVSTPDHVGERLFFLDFQHGLTNMVGFASDFRWGFTRRQIDNQLLFVPSSKHYGQTSQWFLVHPDTIQRRVTQTEDSICGWKSKTIPSGKYYQEVSGEYAFFASNNKSAKRKLAETLSIFMPGKDILPETNSPFVLIYNINTKQMRILAMDYPICRLIVAPDQETFCVVADCRLVTDKMPTYDVGIYPIVRTVVFQVFDIDI